MVKCVPLFLYVVCVTPSVTAVPNFLSRANLGKNLVFLNKATASLQRVDRCMRYNFIHEYNGNIFVHTFNILLKHDRPTNNGNNMFSFDIQSRLH